ncbi:hypothetical protein IG631_16519 [Alternaria alternata]|nr:hypothetical protein IG631_16519 [Alternaria alternata]
MSACRTRNRPGEPQAARAERSLPSGSSKSQNEQDLQKTLELSSTTIEEAQSGLALLNQWGSEQKIKDDYRAKAAGRWSDATAFKN